MARLAKQVFSLLLPLCQVRSFPIPSIKSTPLLLGRGEDTPTNTPKKETGTEKGKEEQEQDLFNDLRRIKFSI